LATTRVSASADSSTIATGVSATFGGISHLGFTSHCSSPTSGACFAAEGVATEEAPIVIGENMEGRVIPHAEDIGAEYYKPTPGAPPSEWMANNRAWIQEQMARGRQIIDIGPDPTRAAYPLETSPYYAMEHGEIFGSGYANYMQHWLDEPELFLQATAH
jgi:hypothetical protein